jgi:hypothetical protein
VVAALAAIALVVAVVAEHVTGVPSSTGRRPGARVGRRPGVDRASCALWRWRWRVQPVAMAAAMAEFEAAQVADRGGDAGGGDRPVAEVAVVTDLVVANLVRRRDPGAPVTVARERRSAIGAGVGGSPEVAQELGVKRPPEARGCGGDAVGGRAAALRAPGAAPD